MGRLLASLALVGCFGCVTGCGVDATPGPDMSGIVSPPPDLAVAPGKVPRADAAVPRADAAVAMPPDDAAVEESPPDLTEPEPDWPITPLIVHEWGTYTSLAGPDGVPQPGMFHTEEQLPGFVHSRNGEALSKWKGMEAPPSGVTQKLETPVIYFHTGTPQEVTVKVDFPKGLISEWYPRASAYLPDVVQNKVPVVAAGSMTWKARLMPGLTGPAVLPESVWAPSRQVAAMPLRSLPFLEDEQFIFYRGVGAFDMPVHVTSDAMTGKITVANDSPDAVPALILLAVANGKIGMLDLKPLAAKSTVTVDPANAAIANDDLAARATIVGALKATGLYEDEAKAMVDTWARSYFQQDGLRLLYVVPRAWTDALLPLSITPKPDDLVRTLVGRIEIFTDAEAATLRASVASELANQKAPYSAATRLTNLYGRTVEARLRYAVPGIVDALTRAYGEQVIAALAGTG